MDDILASIRKIIAEDPVREPPAAAAPPEVVPGSLSARLNDVFGPAPVAHPRPLGPAGGAPPSGSIARNAVDDDLAGLVVPGSGRTLHFGLPPAGQSVPSPTAPPPAPAVAAPSSPFARPAVAVVPPPVRPFVPVLGAEPAIAVPPAAAPLATSAPAPADAGPAGPAARPSEPVVIASMPPLSGPAPAPIAVTPARSSSPFDLSSLAPANRFGDAAPPPRPEPILRMEFSKAAPRTEPDLPGLDREPRNEAPMPTSEAPAGATAAAERVAAEPAAPASVSSQLAQVAEEIAAEFDAAAEVAPAEVVAEAKSTALASPTSDAPPSRAEPMSEQPALASLRLEEGRSGRAEAPAPAAETFVPKAATASIFPSFSTAVPVEPEPAAIPEADLAPAASVESDVLHADDEPPAVSDAAPLSTIPSLSTTPPEVTSGALTTTAPFDPVAQSEMAQADFDDTAAELLRPMLRQWLDSNMPRIVEKALRRELAERPLGAGAGGEPADGDDPAV